jgi:hypothetical protein
MTQVMRKKIGSRPCGCPVQQPYIRVKPAGKALTPSVGLGRVLDPGWAGRLFEMLLCDWRRLGNAALVTAMRASCFVAAPEPANATLISTDSRLETALTPPKNRPSGLSPGLEWPGLGFTDDSPAPVYQAGWAGPL